MARINVTICSIVLIITLHQVSGLLNVTLEAIDAGRKLMNEVEKSIKYSKREDIDSQMKKITEIPVSFYAPLKLLKNHIARDFGIEDNKCFSTTETYDLQDMARRFTSIDTSLFIPMLAGSTHYLDPVDYLKHLIDENVYENINSKKSFDEKLNKVHAIHASCGQNLLEYLANDNNTQICIPLSHQQLFYNMINKVAIVDAIYYMVSQYSYAYYKVLSDAYDILDDSIKQKVNVLTASWKEKSIIKKMKQYEEDFRERNSKSLQLHKAAMKNAPLNFWNCYDGSDKQKKEEDSTYTKLQNVFQKYIANQGDLNEKRSCIGHCPSLKATKVYGCSDEEICNHQPQCDGNIWECGNDITTSINICLSKNKTNSRYDYVDIDDHRYGKQHGCEDEIVTKSWRRGLIKCQYCMCTCENLKEDGDLYFNLRPVLSDVQTNKVIIGVRFQKVNHVVHIQIQEGKLVNEGIVVSPNWKPVDNYTIYNLNVKAHTDYYVLSWNDSRTIVLDALHAENSRALTGIKFESANGLLNLRIQVTEFDFATGMLSVNKSSWISKDDSLDNRSALDMDQLKPNETTVFDPSQYVKFTTSSMDVDVGQSTVPYINIQNVETNSPVPVSGAGLYVKHVDEVGPVLGLQLFTVDFEPYIDV